jgi:type VI secretion system VasD/TssJ family lipoprotein
MNRRRVLEWLGLAPAALLYAGPLRAEGLDGASRRLALVIGNSDYPQAPLPNPGNDAQLIASTLRSLAFEVNLHLNLRGRDFRRVLREYGRSMDEEDRACVFYYAGHGMQLERRNYLLPVDLNLRDEGEVRDEAIDLEDALLGRIDRVRPKARIFIIDACRDNPFGNRPRTGRPQAGLAEMAAPGALIAFSAAPGRAAEDGPPGGNSVYCRALAQEMKTPGLEVEDMLKNVRVKVLKETAERQIPWVNTSMVVNFVFNPTGAATPAAPARPLAAAVPDGVRRLQLSIQAGRSLNTDRQEASASLAMRVYVLSDSQILQRASFDSLYDNDEATLGSALLRRESVHLRPGETRVLELPVSGDARFLGVVAAYRELDRSQWRALLPLPTGELPAAARLDAQARRVELSWTP